MRNQKTFSILSKHERTHDAGEKTHPIVYGS